MTRFFGTSWFPTYAKFAVNDLVVQRLRDVDPMIVNAIRRIDDEQVALQSRVASCLSSMSRSNLPSTTPNLAAYGIAEGAKRSLKISILPIRIEGSGRYAE